MAKKFLFFLIFVFFVTTNNIFACEIKSPKCCCKTQISTFAKKDCCKKIIQKSKQDKSCNGKCGHSGCNIPTVQLVVIVPYITEIEYNPFFKLSEKDKFYNIKTHVSSGFKFIWLPPIIV